MGTVFEELVRRFDEENNEEAGEHWTPRDAVKLMAKLILLPVADEIESGTCLLYDGACGTGGMLTVAEESPHGPLHSCKREFGSIAVRKYLNLEGPESVPQVAQCSLPLFKLRLTLAPTTLAEMTD